MSWGQEDKLISVINSNRGEINYGKSWNSTPIVDLEFGKNSFLANLASKFDLPTEESPIRTILNR